MSGSGDDPIELLCGDLVRAAGRRARGRRRRVRAAAMVAIALLGIVGTAAASSLTGFSTGIDRIDSLLDANHAFQQRAERERAERRDGRRSARCGHGTDAKRCNPPRRSDMRPGPGGASAPMRVPWSGGVDGTAVAYVNLGGSVCLAVAPPASAPTPPAATPPTAGSAPPPASAPPAGLPDRPIDSPAVACALARLITKGLGAESAYMLGMGGTRTRMVLAGFARPGVERVTVDTPAGALPATLSEPWTPAIRGAVPLRAWVATLPVQAVVGRGGLRFLRGIRVTAEP